MAEIFLASSALKNKGFDGIETVAEAKGRFDGVQLYLDKSYRDKNYRGRIIPRLLSTDLKVLLHLPDKPNDDDVAAVRHLKRELFKVRTLVHYGSITTQPVKDMKIGWENSVNGAIGAANQNEHLSAVREAVTRDKTFIVFDMGRMLKTDTETSEDDVRQFIRRELALLRPHKDVLHISDKLTWEGEFRQTMCTLGEGVMRDFLPDIRNFGGVVVLEHEDLQMALESRRVFGAR